MSRVDAGPWPGLAFAAICFLWGTTFLAIKVGLTWLPPLTLGGVQTATAGVILCGWLAWRGVRLFDRATVRLGLVGGALFFLLGNGAVFTGAGRVPSGLAAVFVASIPVFSAVLEQAVIRTLAPAWGLNTGIALALGGMVWLAGPSGGAGALDPFGVVCLLLGSACWAVGGLVIKAARLRGHVLRGPAVQTLCGGLLMLVVAGLKGEWRDIRWEACGPTALFALAYLIVFGSLVAFGCYNWLIAVWSPSRVAAYAFVNPVVALVIGWALGHEALTARSLVAAAVVVAGVAVITLSPIRVRLNRHA